MSWLVALGGQYSSEYSELIPFKNDWFDLLLNRSLYDFHLLKPIQAKFILFSRTFKYLKSQCGGVTEAE